MLLIIEFPNEDEADSYSKDLNKRAKEYSTRKLSFKRLYISDQIRDSKLLDDLFLFNLRLKFIF